MLKLRQAVAEVRGLFRICDEGTALKHVLVVFIVGTSLSDMIEVAMLCCAFSLSRLDLSSGLLSGESSAHPEPMPGGFADVTSSRYFLFGLT